MAKRRDTDGKKVKHKKEGFEYSEELSRRRSRNRIIIAVVVVVALVIVLAMIFLFMGAPEEEDGEKEILTAESTENTGIPANPIEFSATIYNPTKESDIYSPLVLGLPEDWTVDIPQTFSVEGKESKILDFNVTPSLESSLPGTYPFELSVTSGNTQQSFSLYYDVIVIHGSYGVKLHVYNNSHDAEAGRSVAYTLLIENTGNGPDNMTLSYTESHLPANWTVTFENLTVYIPAYDYRIIICTINTSENTTKGRYDIKVRATSSNAFSSEIWLNTSLTKDFDNRTVQIGDKLKVDYIGAFPEGGLFDTSLFDIANNSNFPKAQSFTMRNEEQYEPLLIYVGTNESTDPDYTNVIDGFWEGVLGMKANETVVTKFPPEKGYDDGRWRLFEITLLSIDSE